VNGGIAPNIGSSHRGEEVTEPRSVRSAPADRDAGTRGREILYLHKFILVASAVVAVWAVLFKLP